MLKIEEAGATIPLFLSSWIQGLETTRRRSGMKAIEIESSASVFSSQLLLMAW